MLNYKFTEVIGRTERYLISKNLESIVKTPLNESNMKTISLNLCFSAMIEIDRLNFPDSQIQHYIHSTQEIWLM